jgi:hypothetical protein
MGAGVCRPSYDLMPAVVCSGGRGCPRFAAQRQFRQRCGGGGCWKGALADVGPWKSLTLTYVSSTAGTRLAGSRALQPARATRNREHAERRTPCRAQRWHAELGGSAASCCEAEQSSAASAPRSSATRDRLLPMRPLIIAVASRHDAPPPRPAPRSAARAPCLSAVLPAVHHAGRRGCSAVDAARRVTPSTGAFTLAPRLMKDRR